MLKKNTRVFLQSFIKIIQNTYILLIVSLKFIAKKQETPPNISSSFPLGRKDRRCIFLPYAST